MQKKTVPQKQPSATSARERFNDLDREADERNARRRLELREGMSENLERVALWLPKMIEDEMNARRQRTGLDPDKLRDFYFGGFPLERVNFLRVGVNVFEIGLGFYGKGDVEQMKGFKQLVQAAAAPAVDMDIRIQTNSGWASQMVVIDFDKPFDRNGPYKDLVKKPAAAKAAPKIG